MEVNEYVINVIASFIAVEYMDYGFEKKYRGVKRWICFIAGCSVYFFTLNCLNRFISYEGVLCLFYSAVLILYAVAALKGSLHDKILSALIWILITFIGTLSVYSILGTITGAHMANMLELEGAVFFCAALVASAIKFFMGRVVWKFYEKREEREEAARSDEWMITGIFVLILLSGLFLFQMELGTLEQKTRYVLLTVILVLEFWGVLLLETVCKRIVNYQREQMKVRFKREQEERINHWRHDMNGKLEVLYCLQKRGCYQEVLEHIEMMCHELKSYQELPHETKNEGLNAALLKMVLSCRDENIHFCYTVIGTFEKIDSMDMGTLLFNLFSNGLEACQKAEDRRFIDFIIRESDDKTEIRLENSIGESVIEQNPGFVSKKEQSELHGFGMKSIDTIIRKYKGEYCYSEEEGRFIQEICLRHA